jgi:hypothetical protein
MLRCCLVAAVRLLPAGCDAASNATAYSLASGLLLLPTKLRRCTCWFMPA